MIKWYLRRKKLKDFINVTVKMLKIDLNKIVIVKLTIAAPRRCT